MNFLTLEQSLKVKNKKRINVVYPELDSIFEALKSATKDDFILPVLFGNSQLLEEKCRTFNLDSADIREANSQEEAAEAAVKDIHKGQGQILMKGDLSTSKFLKPVLNRDWGLRKGKVLSHIALCEIPQYSKLIAVADGGINLELNLEVRRAIAENTIEFVQKYVKDTINIAFAAVIEDINEKLPETVDADKLAREFSEKGLIAEGPIALDVIFSQKAAKKKGIQSVLSGNPDIIVAPNMTTANFMVKQMILFNDAKVGGIITGAQVPLVLLSRSDSAATKKNSILLSLL